MITMRVKDMFFDRHVVMRAMDSGKRKVLSQAGAYIRTTARTSIRKRKGTAPPGKPPHSHEGSLRKLILFGYDRTSDSVVVGPVGFVKSTTPRALEHGGETLVHQRRGGRLVSRKVRIAARPFMAPALEKERPKLPLLWRNSIRKGA
ncbi:MAG TPA: hypothetical protein PLG36_10955 [Trueperaceae bacterium]|nr:hypothetical protein [Trueperaceae bacterium]